MSPPAGEIGRLRDEEQLPAVRVIVPADGQGNPDDNTVGLSLGGVDAAVAQAREYLRSVGYPVGGWPVS